MHPSSLVRVVTKLIPYVAQFAVLQRVYVSAEQESLWSPSQNGLYCIEFG
jgi:hypothetical protein